MRKSIYLIPLLATIIFSSCKKEDLFSENAKNQFFLENNDAIMPVQVKGNTSSKVFVIFLHGGPGDSGITGFADNGIFGDLESDYAVVYFDQRCAGLSQGNCDPNTLQVADYNDDIDKLLLVLENIYGNDNSFFLLGHSWGATLGLDYLINGSNKNRIKGYIQSDGSQNIPQLFIEQKDIMTYYANQQIALGNNPNAWQDILGEIVDANPSVNEGRGKILVNAYKTEELLTSVDSVQTSTISLAIGSTLSGIFPSFINSNSNSEFILQLFDYDISNQLNQITTPTALYWGKFDLVHPPNMAIDIFTNLGTTDKELYFFAKSFHSPMINENNEYQLKVKEFIETYR